MPIFSQLPGEVAKSGSQYSGNPGQQVTISYAGPVNSGENYSLIHGHARMHCLQHYVRLLSSDTQTARHEIGKPFIWFLLNTAFTEKIVYTFDRFCTAHNTRNRTDEMQIWIYCFSIV